MDVSWETKRFRECTPDDVFEFAKLRTDVFFLEQHCDEEELDRFDRDPKTTHLWGRVDGEMVAYARVVVRDEAGSEDLGVTTSIGRVVVAPAFRGKGLGQELMARALSAAGDIDVVVHSQTYISTLYEASGFVQFGEPFVEAGIPHVRMVRVARAKQ